MGTEKEKACRDCTLRRLQNLLRRFCERSIQKSEFSIQNCNTLTGNVFKYSDSRILTSLLQTPRRGEVGDRESWGQRKRGQRWGQGKRILSASGSVSVSVKIKQLGKCWGQGKRVCGCGGVWVGKRKS